MDKREARHILVSQLQSLRDKSYSELVKMVGGEPVDLEITGSSGVRYGIEVQIFWDDRPNGNVRVMGAIDDGGWRACFPLCESFIKTPQNTFVGE